MEIGVRPSFDHLAVVEEKLRREWRAGTRKLGRVAAEGMALSSVRLLLGASILGAMNGGGGRRDSGRLRDGAELQKCSIGYTGQSAGAVSGPCPPSSPAQGERWIRGLGELQDITTSLFPNLAPPANTDSLPVSRST